MWFKYIKRKSSGSYNRRGLCVSVCIQEHISQLNTMDEHTQILITAMYFP